MFTPERRVGALGALLLIAAYGMVLAAFGPDRVVSFEPLGLLAFATPAFLVGCLVAAVARWYVPAERLTREAHRRAVTVMLLGPTALIGLAVTLLALLFGAGSSALNEFEAMVTGGGTGAITAFSAFMAVAMLLIILMVIILLIVVLVVLGVVLQLGAVIGYGLTTLALDRYEVLEPAGRPAGEPPD